MIEKGFVRLLTEPEIDDIARRVAVIHCPSCGAAVDIRKDHACPYCRSAFSLIDPKAVEQALQGYASASQGAAGIKVPELADALVSLERDRQRTLRDEKARRGSLFTTEVGPEVDLWGLGLSMVRHMLD